MANQTELIVDVTKIQRAAQTGIPLSITTYTLPREMEKYINDILSAFLRELHHEELYDYLSYCLRELAINAKKANTKRVYFQEKNLNIADPVQYEEGMKNFKMETLTNIDHYLNLQKTQGFYIKIFFQVKNNLIKLEIHNNVVLTPFEYKRIHDKIVRAEQYSSIEETFLTEQDETEGAGLGLIIMILMLRKIGGGENSYHVETSDGETIVTVSLPLNAEIQDEFDVLSREIVSRITDLPQFPENILAINRLLNDPASELMKIAHYVASDPALTADLLRLVNSSAFSLSRKCRSIHEAIKMVGIKGLKNILYSLGSIQTLGSSTAEQRRIWNHCYKTAFYAQYLAKNFPKMHAIIDDAYVCGLLHDMGKIIFSNVHPDLEGHIVSFSSARDIPKELFERLSAGINHAEIGALIAEKWNFPDIIIQTIRFHHNPENSPEDIRMLVSVVYLANMLTHYQEQQIEYYQFEQGILKKLNITSEEQIQKLLIQIQSAFEAEGIRSS
ncbi:MAG: HDOD domain-containing protein [Spirochaetaceae bacterium]|jgi:putative nucleotidyltransferase with HDIG domain|nr:HDOD domain-containing protein [Spirochaetaceae bacterium]